MRGGSRTNRGILGGVRRTAPRLAPVGLIIGLLALAGCGSSTTATTTAQRSLGAAPAAGGGQAHPQAVEPVPGEVSQPTPSDGPGSVSVSAGSAGGAVAQPISNAQVQAELAASGLSANPDQSTLTADRLAIPPIAAPAQVQEVIDAGNEIAHLPYVWGGGHQTYEDDGYDCSGSLSFVLAAAGLLKGTETSGQLMSYGEPGPGKWITIYAAPGHTFMYVAGLRFDTVALAQTGSRWSNRSATEGGGFVARHPPGL
jgi:cell wall-associated NlpC family hydrolase